MNNQENLNRIKIIAEENNGKLVSPNWLRRSKKHIFEFSDGSQFETTPLSLKLNG